MELFIAGVLGYLFGNINPAYILSKRRGFDIREEGSHNAGASNALLLMGKKAGAITAVVDIAKAYVVAMLAGFLFPEYAAVKEMAAVFCILGHIFPITMGFKGGKGLACIAGGVLAYNVKFFAIMFVIEMALALITDYICVLPISAAIVIPVLYAYKSGDLIVLGFMSITSVVIICKHIENIRRIFQGLEVRISYLWNREEEIRRIEENSGKSAEC
jgi:glycerol-3-phosphate acyltransferase PlsY